MLKWFISATYIPVAGENQSYSSSDKEESDSYQKEFRSSETVKGEVDDACEE